MNAPAHSDYQRFLEWLRIQHPGTQLTSFQHTMVYNLLSVGMGAGRSTIIELLYEFDQKYSQLGKST